MVNLRVGREAVIRCRRCIAFRILWKLTLKQVSFDGSVLSEVCDQGIDVAMSEVPLDL